jgi:hypothetical protein
MRSPDAGAEASSQLINLTFSPALSGSSPGCASASPMPARTFCGLWSHPPKPGWYLPSRGHPSWHDLLHNLQKLALHERLQQSRHAARHVGRQFVVACRQHDGRCCGRHSHAGTTPMAVHSSFPDDIGCCSARRTTPTRRTPSLPGGRRHRRSIGQPGDRSEHRSQSAGSSRDALR